MHIGDRTVGAGAPVLVVAELSGNHGQDLDRALELVREAARCGADAVKLQTYTPDTITLSLDAEPFRVKGTRWDGRTLHDLYGEAYTPWEWHEEIFATGRALGLTVFSTPFDATAVDFLEKLDTPVYKIASFEVVDIPLLTRVARTGRPVIMSTGMATLEEIDEAVRTLRAGGTQDLALLKCTSAYPAQPADMHLLTIPHLARSFDVVVGLSDHTLGVAVPAAAVALGAAIIEKHLTLSRAEPGPDSAFSLEPEEFRQMVDAARTAQAALGTVSYGGSAAERDMRVFRRSLFVVQDVKAGDEFTLHNVRSIRPGHGLHTRHLGEVLGCRAAIDVSRGTPLAWHHVERGGSS